MDIRCVAGSARKKNVLTFRAIDERDSGFTDTPTTPLRIPMASLPANSDGRGRDKRMTGAPQKALFDPSYTTDGVSPRPAPWGCTRHALNPAVPVLLDRVATGLQDQAGAQREINQIAKSYGELLRQHEVPDAGVGLACAALRHAFDDTARWVVRRRAIDPMAATAISVRIAHLAEGAIDVVARSYGECGRRIDGGGFCSPLPPNMMDLLAFTMTLDRVRTP